MRIKNEEVFMSGDFEFIPPKSEISRLSPLSKMQELSCTDFFQGPLKVTGVPILYSLHSRYIYVCYNLSVVHF